MASLKNPILDQGALSSEVSTDENLEKISGMFISGTGSTRDSGGSSGSDGILDVTLDSNLCDTSSGSTRDSSGSSDLSLVVDSTGDETNGLRLKRIDEQFSLIWNSAPQENFPDRDVFDYAVQSSQRIVKSVFACSERHCDRMGIIIERFQAYSCEVDCAMTELHTSKLFDRGQLNSVGVMDYMEGFVFSRLKDYKKTLEIVCKESDELPINSSPLSQKWEAALRCSKKLCKTFDDVQQYFMLSCAPFHLPTFDRTMIPDVAVRTAQNLLRDQGAQNVPSRLRLGVDQHLPKFVQIERNIVGKDGEDFLIGICHYLDVQYFVTLSRYHRYAQSRVDSDDDSDESYVEDDSY